MDQEDQLEAGSVGSDPPVRQVLRNVTVSMGIAALMATVFTAWVPAGLNPAELAGELISAADRQGQSTPAAVADVPEPDGGRSLRVGVVVGHAGPNRQTGYKDPGSECADGLSELEINQEVAGLVASGLAANGITVDLLEEFDEMLMGYRAVALVSIHADSCIPINDEATGFKVTAALDTAIPDRAQRLVDCLADRYEQTTGLRFHPASITRDMTEYHSFYEIHTQTPAVIIETGFMFLDRDFLTKSPDVAARGIVRGIMCYVNNEPATLPSGR